MMMVMAYLRSLILYSAFCATMTGCVPLALGTAANVGVASTEERSLGDSLDDSAISAEVNQFFIQKGKEHLFGDVSIRVHEGRVLLTGRTDSDAIREQAAELAWQAHGVREVINEIKVGAESAGTWDYLNDNAIETQVEARLLADKNVKSQNYTVEVVDGTAYLLGVAQTEKERNIAAYIASVSKGVREVVSYVRLKDDPLRLQKVGKPRDPGINRRRGITN
jgi:osmotically-inducible protein OsmY